MKQVYCTPLTSLILQRSDWPVSADVASAEAKSAILGLLGDNFQENPNLSQTIQCLPRARAKAHASLFPQALVQC